MATGNMSFVSCLTDSMELSFGNYDYTDDSFYDIETGETTTALLDIVLELEQTYGRLPPIYSTSLPPVSRV